MGDVVKLSHGRTRKGAKLPKPALCKECDEPIETARLQALGLSDPHLKPLRCVSCARAHERRFERQMQGIRDHEAVRVIR